MKVRHDFSITVYFNNKIRSFQKLNYCTLSLTFNIISKVITIYIFFMFVCKDVLLILLLSTMPFEHCAFKYFVCSVTTLEERMKIIFMIKKVWKYFFFLNFKILYTILLFYYFIFQVKRTDFMIHHLANLIS